MTTPDLIGLVGVVIVLAAYFFLQAGKLILTGYKFSIMNAVGSSLILVSLFFNFNIASFVIESAWIAISIYGILKTLRQSNEI
ncbi:MAG: hypothetical protein Q9M46_05315 [Ghiorsea sp.]|nr:hypothetical protein [Ghiorsea sp.]